MRHNSNKTTKEQQLTRSNGIPTNIGGLNFLVTIHHTEHHSWQGTIEWLNTNQKIHFRSSLEMMQLIDKAVQVSDMKTTTLTDERSWTETLQEAK